MACAVVGCTQHAHRLWSVRSKTITFFSVDAEDWQPPTSMMPSVKYCTDCPNGIMIFGVRRLPALFMLIVYSQSCVKQSFPQQKPQKNVFLHTHTQLGSSALLDTRPIDATRLASLLQHP